jgi:hypothetical protein
MDLNNIIETTHYVNENESEFMVLLDSEILNKFSEMWEFNRRINYDKVDEIKKHIRNKNILDTMLYFFKIDNKLICLDGCHRSMAVKDLYITDQKILKVLCYIYIPKTDNVNLEIRDKFNLLNKNTPIPDIYLDILKDLNHTNELNLRRDIIEDTFDEYKVKYKEFYKTSNKCQKPNFNDTMFKDLCNFQTFNTKDELLIELDNLNETNKTKRMTTRVKAKCSLHDFYLFN